MKPETSEQNYGSRASGIGSQLLASAEAVLEAMSAAPFHYASKTKGIFIVGISDEFKKLTGYSEGEVLGRSLDFLYGSNTDPRAVRSINRAAAGGKPFQGELLCYRADGKGIWCTLVLAPAHSSKEHLPSAGALFDISERKLLEEQFRSRETNYRGIFENAVEGIYRSTPDGAYLEVNPALARMYGYSNPQQLLSQVHDIQGQIYVDATMRERFKKAIEETDVVRGLEYRVRRLDGRIIWISESARVVRDKHGRARYYEGFIEEITQRKEAEAALQASQRQLLETSRQIGMAEVATGILHNMGNALNSVNVSAAVIADKVFASKVKGVAKAAALMEANATELGRFITTDPRGKHLPKYLGQLGEHLVQEQAALQEELKRLRKSLEHINAILSTQQSYAKGSATAEKVSPIELMEDALCMSGSWLARNEVEVVREYANDMPVAKVPKHAVLQILINLIGNAQKACQAADNRAKRIVLRVGASHSGRFVRMEVADNGVGIPKANLERIFDHGFTTRKDGHGFGLHSGAMMAKELGGSLMALSDGPGKGSTFTFEFPSLPR
jgi:PAS domain S-box-containing protein